MRHHVAPMLLLAGAALTTPAHAQIALPFGSPDRTESPYFEVEGYSGLDRLPLKDTRVDVHVSGVVASVVVRQTYENEGSLPINARYVFPASTRAAVSGMRMRIGARVVEAEIREKERARREFEQAKREGKAAALLEEHRPNVFEMGVANILPGEQIEVELRYTELIVPTDGLYEFVYPTVVGPRYTGGGDRDGPIDGAPAGEVTRTAGDVLSTAGVATSAVPPTHDDGWAALPNAAPEEGAPSGFDIRAAIAAGMRIRELEVPSHRVESEWSGRGAVRVELDESEWGKGDRDFILRYRLADDRVTSGLILQEGKDENFFALLVQPPRRVTPRHVPPREFVFVLDVSGSMRGFPLETAKELLHDLVSDLGQHDAFNVLLFAGASQLLSERSIAATPENIERAKEFIDNPRGGGGTELGRAMRRAMELPRSAVGARTVVLITDGYITHEEDVFRLIRSSLDETSVFSFGIGKSVNRFLVEGVARAGLGEPFVVTGPEAAAETADRFRDYVSSPVLTDVRLSLGGFEAYDVEPAVIPAVFADRPLVIQGKWRGEATGRVEISGVTGHGEYAHAFDVAELDRSDSDALAQLWARTRVRNLLDQALSGPNDTNRSKIVSLGLRYHLLTPYTSFVAVDKVVRTDERGREVTQPAPPPPGPDRDSLRAYQDSAAAAQSLRVGSEPELWILALLTTVLLLGTSRRFRAHVAPVRWALRHGRPRGR